jgi:hypothetical protein
MNVPRKLTISGGTSVTRGARSRKTFQLRKSATSSATTNSFA